jgi:GTP-sensing pleiotropic transcriptional regulator CodY
LLLQPSLSFRLSEAFAVNIGPYYMLQKIGNEDDVVKSRVTDKIGSYNSLLNNAALRKQQNYGVNLGLSLSF